MSSLGPHPQFPSSVKPGIPRIKKPEFGWKTVSIGELFDVVVRPVDMQDDVKYRLVTVRRSRGGVVLRSALFGNEVSVKSQFYLKNGDFLISRRQIVHGACGFVSQDLDGAIVSNEYSVLRCKNIILPRFLNYLTHSPYFQQTCFHSSIGVHVEKMIFKLDDWFKWEINIPVIEKQKEIVEFLTVVDQKIEKLTQKRDLLQQYKKGLMQQLFSQQLRFKQDDGSEFPDWNRKKLNDVVEVNPRASNLPALFTYIDLESVKKGQLIEAKKITKEDAPSRAQRTLLRGDIIFQCVRPYQKNNYYFDHEGEYVASSGYAQLRPRESGQYIYQLLFTHNFVSEVISRCTGTSYPAISAGDLSMIAIPLPHIDEQQKIANVLQSLDKKIEKVMDKITKTKQFKKALLQKMFI